MSQSNSWASRVARKPGTSASAPAPGPSSHPTTTTLEPSTINAGPPAGLSNTSDTTASNGNSHPSLQAGPTATSKADVTSSTLSGKTLVDTSAPPCTAEESGTRLRLPARLGNVAPAPLLSRSQSTNAILQSGNNINNNNSGGSSGLAKALAAAGSSGISRNASLGGNTAQSMPPPGLNGLNAITRSSSSSGTTVTPGTSFTSLSSSNTASSSYFSASSTISASTANGTSIPSAPSLQSTLGRRASVSTAAPSQSLPSRGLPSLEEVQKRFALKKEKEKGHELEQEKPMITATTGDVRSGPPPKVVTETATSASTKRAPLRDVPVDSADKRLSNQEKPSEPKSNLAENEFAEARKENINPETGIDTTPSHVVESIPPTSQKPLRSLSMVKTDSDSSSGSSIPSPTTPVDAAPSSLTGTKKSLGAADHPLQHPWTLYYDSRATARAAAAKPPTPTSAVEHPNGTAGTTLPLAAGKTQYEAGLATLGSVRTVESFCRLYNWLKKPSKMGMNENLHFFKDGILPMWEDERNKHGGKWTIAIDSRTTNVKELADRYWMWLCFALIGEDFEERNDLICGAVISTRPRYIRLQVWLSNKEDITALNAVGKNLIRILELEHPVTGAHPPGVSLDFSYHSKNSPPPNKFVQIVPAPLPTPSAAFQAHPGAGIGIQHNNGIGNFPGNPGNAKVLTPSGSGIATSFNRNGGGGNAFGSIGLSRAVSMNAIASKLNQNGPDGNSPVGAPMNWRERLGQGSRKSSLAA